MSTTIKITNEWQTIATVGFSGCVNAYDSNPAAHGAVCHFEARGNAIGRLVGRKVNSNGRHQEISETFPLTRDRLALWQKLAR
jgi:monoamine oxidase